VSYNTEKLCRRSQCDRESEAGHTSGRGLASFPGASAGAIVPTVNKPISPKRGTDMKIQIKQVESIKATRMHLDPEAGGA
jgi:hypothetical protein